MSKQQRQNSGTSPTVISSTSAWFLDWSRCWFFCCCYCAWTVPAPLFPRPPQNTRTTLCMDAVYECDAVCEVGVQYAVLCCSSRTVFACTRACVFVQVNRRGRKTLEQRPMRGLPKNSLFSASIDAAERKQESTCSSRRLLAGSSRIAWTSKRW